MTTRTTARNSVSDLWDTTALRAGLKHVDGQGGRSTFEGTREQWEAFRAAVEAVSATTANDKRSHKAVLGRIEWALSWIND